MHEDPQIPNYGGPDQRTSYETWYGIVYRTDDYSRYISCSCIGDDWTAVTVDGKPAAHFEHTVVVTENGPEISTMRDEPRLIK